MPLLLRLWGHSVRLCGGLRGWYRQLEARVVFNLGEVPVLFVPPLWADFQNDTLKHGEEKNKDVKYRPIHF